MESANSAPGQAETTLETEAPSNQSLTEQWFSESFENLLPKIQDRWPDLAQQTLEATRGSLDEVIRVISQHSGKTPFGVQEQLEELLDSASAKTKDLANSLEPLEKQLEELLDDLNKNLRPRIEKPIRQRPLLALGIATSFGVILGMLLTRGRRN